MRKWKNDLQEEQIGKRSKMSDEFHIVAILGRKTFDKCSLH